VTGEVRSAIDPKKLTDELVVAMDLSSSPIDFQAMLLLVDLLARHGIVAREKNINPDNLEKREPKSRRGRVPWLG
jgi:hypothetical protein